MLDKGPCEIVWGYGDSDAAYLGKTLGDVKLGMETEVSDVNEDQAGNAPVNAAMLGSTLTLEVPLTRLSLEQLRRVMNEDEIAGLPCVVPIRNQVGCDMYSLAKALVIKPTCGGVVSANPCEWVHIYKCYPIAGLDLTYNKDTQRIFPVKFKIFVSQETADGIVGCFGTIGMDSGASVL
jgi:hypothetical protein